MLKFPAEYRTFLCIFCKNNALFWTNNKSKIPFMLKDKIIIVIGILINDNLLDLFLPHAHKSKYQK